MLAMHERVLEWVHSILYPKNEKQSKDNQYTEVGGLEGRTVAGTS